MIPLLPSPQNHQANKVNGMVSIGRSDISKRCAMSIPHFHFSGINATNSNPAFVNPSKKQPVRNCGMIIVLRDWGVDVDVTPCFGKGFRIRGTSDSPEHPGKLFHSLEIQSFDAKGIMTCMDGCLYQAIGPASLGRLSARIDHVVVLREIVQRTYRNFHVFLTTLTAWTKVIQPLLSRPELCLPNRSGVLNSNPMVHLAATSPERRLDVGVKMPGQLGPQ